jgi:hypothetical protein
MTKETKEILEQLTFSMVYDDRIGLINSILEFSGDEIIEKEDFIKLAKAKKKKLRIQLHSIFMYYFNNQM